MRIADIVDITATTGPARGSGRAVRGDSDDPAGARAAYVAGSSALWSDTGDLAHAAERAPLPVSYRPGAEAGGAGRAAVAVPEESGGRPARRPGGPSRVRALPVAVPLRRRPAMPERGAGWDARERARSGEPRGTHRSTASAGALWADVRPWGIEPRGPRVCARTWARADREADRRWLTGGILGGAAAVVLGIGLAVSGPAGAGAIAAPSQGADAGVGAAAAATSTRIAVAPGDTLWDIAAARTPEGGDVRDAALRIAQANGLDGGVLQAGQVLTIPAELTGS